MNLKNAIDDLLELSFVGSFTRVGPAVRRRLFGWDAPTAGALDGRTALVTGPTSGLGRAVAEQLAGLGARVILVGRNRQRLESVRDALIRAHGEDRFPIVVADMSSLVSVRAAVSDVLASERQLDVVVDNAGAIFAERTESTDGFESTFAVLVMGPFVLLGGLLPLLQETPGSRVIAITSGGMYTQALDLNDLQSRAPGYSGSRAYARAKRAQTSLIREWARRLSSAGPTFHTMHPGWADTPGLADSLPAFYRFMKPLLRSPAEGADSVTWLASTPDPSPLNGQLILDRRSRPFDRIARTRLSAADRRRLWDQVVALSGGQDPAPEARTSG
ncbi:MAG: SDR family NAD(P)-dependent oxidoreductase [Chloroflexota bacterium]